MPDMPYLTPDPDQAAAWRGRLAGLRGRRVGLVWAGARHFGDPAGIRMGHRGSLR